MKLNSDGKTSNILFYMHAGSGNHGCEAIVRSLCDILDDRHITLLSNRIDEDQKYGLESDCDIKTVRRVNDNIVAHLYYYVLKKLFRNGKARMAYEYASAGDMSAYDCAVSIGGDNYCYEDTLYDLKMAHLLLETKGVKTALVGCSIEPDIIERRDVADDLNKYSVIIARESITYEALKARLDSKVQIELVPDPAFAMMPEVCDLLEGFLPSKTVGINVSPMILGYEDVSHPGITLSNYKNLIATILAETTDVIALIPHVVTPYSDDRQPLQKLYDYYQELTKEHPEYAGRVLLVQDHPARQLKYIISQCKMLIAARTHATIAAYSTCVPTLVVGYSVKARGIARDLFGETDGYVLPVQSLIGENDLVNAYRKLELSSEEQKTHLQAIMPDYIARTQRIKELI